MLPHHFVLFASASRCHSNFQPTDGTVADLNNVPLREIQITVQVAPFEKISHHFNSHSTKSEER
jgi:hypothetical protein